MCGIAGIIALNQDSVEEIVRSMVSISAYRGPDFSRVEKFEFACVGHSRLVIIDNDKRSNQPFTDNSGYFSIVYNGEVYNYLELKKDLETHYEFKTTSDTEVVLAAYIIYGESFLEKLNGMFAFCILDHKRQTAFLARDRFGQKPLFYSFVNGKFVFASEIKSIFQAGAPREPNLLAWSRYLSYALMDDGSETFFKDVYQLKPGEAALLCPDGTSKFSTYYDVGKKCKQRNISFKDASEIVRELMFDAVQIHMRSDVPVGVSLSGGLDSSSILSCLSGTNTLPDDLACFSMEYGNDHSEKRWIESAADRFELRSQFVNFSRYDFLNSIRSTMWHQEAPIGGLPNCALMAMMASVQNSGVRVIQDGTGLDEAFGGYRNHHNLFLGLKIRDNAKDIAIALGDYANTWGVSKKEAYHAALGSLSTPNAAIDGTLPTRPDLLLVDDLREHFQRSQKELGEGDILKSQFATYLQRSKIPRNMRMKDRASMSFGIELRLPFLDHRLVEFGLSLPNEFFFKNGLTKSIVRAAMKHYMHDDVRLAQKRSIQSPQDKWLKTEPIYSYVLDILNSESFGSRGLVDPNKAKIAYLEFCSAGSSNSLFVWQWIVLEEWFRIFIDSDPANYLTLNSSNFFNSNLSS